MRRGSEGQPGQRGTPALGIGRNLQAASFASFDRLRTNGWETGGWHGARPGLAFFDLDLLDLVALADRVDDVLT